MRILRHGHTLFYIAIAIVVLVIFAALFAWLLLDYDSVTVSTGDRLLPPGSQTSAGSTALLGTDQLGRDMTEQVLEGAKISLLVGLVTLMLAGSIGSIAGLAAGYFGGWFDRVLMRLGDIQLAFPSILLAILIAGVLGPSIQNVIITLALTRWVVFARVARSTTLKVRNLEYVDASRNLGAGTFHLLRKCVAPAAISPVLVVATIELGQVILAEASLSFLGLGTPQTDPSWGLTIANGRNYLAQAWWISTVPGIALAALVTSVGIIGDHMRDRLDPHMAGLPTNAKPFTRTVSEQR